MPHNGFTHESQKNESKEWYTPKYIFDALGLYFDLDVASPGKEKVSWIPAKTHLTKEDDGLEWVWAGRIWMNPPYGLDTSKWMKKFYKHPNGIALVFARTDTSWFHDYAIKCDGILFLKKRIKFIKPDGTNAGSPGCGSMLIAKGRKEQEALKSMENNGFGYYLCLSGLRELKNHSGWE